MEAIVDNNNFFSNLDFFHNLRDHSKKDLAEMNVKKIRNRRDILTPKQYKVLLKSNRPADVEDKKINKALGTEVPISNYAEKIMGFYGFVLHHLDNNVKNIKDVVKQRQVLQALRESTSEYNKLLKEQKRGPKSQFLLRLMEYTRKFLSFSKQFETKKTPSLIDMVFGDKDVINTEKIQRIFPSRLDTLQKAAELQEGRQKGRKVKQELSEERAKRNQLQNILNNMTNENIRQKEQQPLFKKIEKIVPEEIIKDNEKLNTEERILKALRENKNVGTVASLSGFFGITTASILARIIGNSTANYISSPHKSNGNASIGDKKDSRQKLIDLIKQERTIDTERLENDIDHLRQQIDDRENIKNIDKRQKKKMKRSRKHTRFNRNEIQLINVINRL